MDEAAKQQLEEAGVDIAGAAERFMGNMSMLAKFLKKFPADPNYAKLKEAVEQGDKEGALTASHTLKGVCGNLSIVALHELLAKQVDSIRQGDWEKAVAIMPEISAEYEKVNSTIVKCLP